MSGQASVPTLSGLVFGVGTELAVSKNVSLDLHYTYAKFDTLNVVFNPTTSAALDLDVQTVQMGVKYRTNLFGG